MKSYIVKEKDNKLVYSDTLIVDNPASLKLVDHPIRMQILQLLAKEPMYPAELARKLKLHEQKVYYHIKQMTNSGLLEIVEKKEVRGTMAKKMAPKVLNFSFTLSKDWKTLSNLVEKKDDAMVNFLKSFRPLM